MKKIRSLCTVVVTVIGILIWFGFFSQSGEADFNKGNNFEKQGNYKKAIECYEKSAEDNYAGAYTNLGVLYLKGKGVNINYNKAFKYFKIAAEKGDGAAYNNLGVCYTGGYGVDIDYEKALNCYKKAVDLGYEEAKERVKELENILYLIEEN